MYITWLVASAFLCWFQVTSASLIAARAWTPSGLGLAFGNRDAMPDADAFAARARRAAANMVENLPLLAVIVLAGSLAKVPEATLDLGTAIFFWARIAHAACYLAGVPYLRTLAWGTSLAGLGIIGVAAL